MSKASEGEALGSRLQSQMHVREETRGHLIGCFQEEGLAVGLDIEVLLLEKY